MPGTNAPPETMRRFFLRGATRTYQFRRQQLIALRNAIKKYERHIESALYADLKKNPEEVYATETGLVVAELNVALKNLRRWMRPRRVPTNLVNFPSSSKIIPEPLGVVLIISPWNFPFQLALIPMIGAIAGGNCVLLKPSELSPATSDLLERMVQDIFPSDYVQVMQGDGAEIIPSLMKSFRFDHVFFTGGTEVGKKIYSMAARDLIPVTLELGGKSPAIVEADANLEVAARRIALGKFVNAGQTCVAPDYVLADMRIMNSFLERLRVTILQFFEGDAKNSYSYGRIINESRFDHLVRLLGDGKIILGGGYDRAALFIEPTVVTDLTPSSLLMQEEIFGPILPVIGFSSRDEALDLIQRNDRPLSFYVFTSNGATEKYWIDSVSFGGGCVNNACWQFANHHLPFGGVGNSGLGAYHGKFTFDTFVHRKAVMKTATWFDPPLKYPPFRGKLRWFKKLIR